MAINRFRQLPSSMNWLSLFLIFQIINFLSNPVPAQAHSYSASYTNLTMSENKTELVFTLDTLSILELIPDIDHNKNWVLENSEIKKEKHHLEELITEGLTLDKNNQEQTPTIKKMEIVKKENKEFVSIHMIFPKFSPGQTISFNDGFYFNDFATNYVDLISISYLGQKSEAVLQGKDRTWTILLTEVQQEQGSEQAITQQHTEASQAEKTQPSQAAASTSWFSFFKLGMLHILTGYDHLLFLFALLFRKQTLKQYLAIITSFTIAHSITLSLAVLGWVSLPSKFVEAVIAFSICYVAVENIFRKEIKHRWSITFLFGLIHGLGFASILREMAIPKSHLAAALINFNVGIEFIQLLIVLLLLPVLTVIQKQNFYGKTVQIGSIMITSLGAFWLVQRLFF